MYFTEPDNRNCRVNMSELNVDIAMVQSVQNIVTN